MNHESSSQAKPKKRTPAQREATLFIAGSIAPSHHMHSQSLVTPSTEESTQKENKRCRLSLKTLQLGSNPQPQKSLLPKETVSKSFCLRSSKH
jgi:hypothetical protein